MGDSQPPEHRGPLTAAPDKKENGEGVSFETLVVAALSSAIAAIVVSQFWQGGTPIAAAVTPVIVSLVSEGLRRPMRSEAVRRSASRAVELGATPVRRYRTSEQPVLMPGGPERDRRERPTEPLMPATNGERPPDEPTYSVYRPENGARPSWRERLSRRRVKIAVITGLMAFVIAGLVLTLPELLFGGSVTGTDRNTTFFGGGDKDRGGDREGRNRDEDRDSDSGGGSDTPSPDRPSGSAPEPDEGEDAPSDEPPSEEPPPQDEAPAPSPVPEPPPEVPNQP